MREKKRKLLAAESENKRMWVGASAPTHCENKESNDASGLKRLSNSCHLGASASRLVTHIFSGRSFRSAAACCRFQ
jgi:hypothetical protein